MFILHRYIITTIVLSLFLGACHQETKSDYADESNPETTRQKDDNTGKKEDLHVDSSNIVVFDMYHNQTKWGKK
jgi:major membrane immunogen (membrane-anchored lipoprotein)